MEFRHLRYFLVLAEELHFGRAARRLAISQPPLSTNIQQLESSVGARLFVRNSRGVRLTAAGQAFVPEARAVLDRAARALTQARDVAQGVSDTLRIGFAGTMLYRGLPQILRVFEQAAPAAQVRVVLRELSSRDQLAELTQGRLDAGLVHSTRVPAEFSQVLVSSQPFVLCLPAGHRLARRRAVDLGELGAQPLALVSREVSPDYHESIVAACEDQGWAPAARHELQHWLSVVSLVAQGLAAALVPQALRQAGIAGAVFVPLKGQELRYHTHCLWRPQADRAALAAWVDAVGQVARQQA